MTIGFIALDMLATGTELFTEQEMHNSKILVVLIHQALSRHHVSTFLQVFIDYISRTSTVFFNQSNKKGSLYLQILISFFFFCLQVNPNIYRKYERKQYQTTLNHFFMNKLSLVCYKRLSHLFELF